MKQRYNIEPIKEETKGILREKHRVTSVDTEGNVGVSEWQGKKSDAERESRVRVGEQRQKANK